MRAAEGVSAPLPTFEVSAIAVRVNVAGNATRREAKDVPDALDDSLGIPHEVLVSDDDLLVQVRRV